jgi:hypothetical protein
MSLSNFFYNQPQEPGYNLDWIYSRRVFYNVHLEAGLIKQRLQKMVYKK